MKIKCLMVMAVLVLFGAGAAKADVIFVDTYLLGGPLGNPAAELSWVIGETGVTDLVYFSKLGDVSEAGVVPLSAFDVDFGLSTEWGDSEALISWDLSGYSYELYYILLKDGQVEGGHLYALYGVTEDQRISSNGWQLVDFDEFNKDISHITFFGKAGRQRVPEPGTLLLLGSGLFAMGFARRWFRK